MLDLYVNANPHLKPYIARAHRARAVYFKLQLRRLARAAQRLWRRYGCWRIYRRAIRELGALNDAALKDIGIGRSEIWYRVAAAQPAGCRG